MKGSLVKKKENWYVVLTVNGKQKWFSGGGKSKRKAQSILNEKLGEIQAGEYKELKAIDFGKFTDLWLSTYAEMKLKASTLRSYRDMMKNHIVPFFGERTKLQDIDTGRIQQYVAQRLRHAKPKTVLNELVPMKELFKHAVQWDYLKKNPAEYVERPRVEREEMEVLTPSEINLLLDHVTPKYKPLIFTAVLTGMRRGELFGLQWGDIDWIHNQIHVRHSLCRVSKKLTTPKSKKSIRKIDMSPTLVHELKKHKLACPPSDLDLVFPSGVGTMADADTFIRRHFLPALRRAGLREVRFHDLRHSNVAMRIEQGQNPVYIARQVGHSSVKTTLDVYGHLIKDVNPEQATKLDSMLGYTEHKDKADIRNPLEPGNKKEVAVYATP